MKRILFLLLLLSIYAFGQCLGSPISTRAGLKFGFNIRTHDPGAGGEHFSGTGMHFGLGMGTDIVNLLAIDMTPQIRSTNHGRDELLGRRTYSFTNLYFPIFLSLKAGMIPLVSPYLGLGIGFNIQFNGVDRFEFNNGSATENPIEGSATTGFLILGLGTEVKLAKFRISPEFTANLQPKEDENAAATTDYHISLGFYYVP
jgi:hypothetical protein